MITRRRGRAINNADVQIQEVEVVDVVETVEDLPEQPGGCPAGDTGDAGLDELNDLFGIEDLKWTLGRGSSSTLFDMDLADLDMYSTKGHDSGFDVSTGSSPERTPSDTTTKNRQNRPSQHINKNAIAARLNRLKKKEYVDGLEKKVDNLATENNALKRENSQLTKRVDELEDETRGPAPTTMTMLFPGSA